MFIVFDLDDTLYDLRSAFDRAHMKMFPEIKGIDLGELFECVRRYSYDSLEMTAKGLLRHEDEFAYRITRAYADYGIEVSRQKCDEYEKLYRNEQKDIRLFDGADRLLDYHAAHAEGIAVMTNGMVEVQMGKARRLKLTDWIPEERIFISDDLGYRKPDVRACIEVERRLGAKPEQITMIGDTYKADMSGSIERGWRTIWFNHRHNRLPEGAAEPNITVYTMEELLQIK